MVRSRLISGLEPGAEPGGRTNIFQTIKIKETMIVWLILASSALMFSVSAGMMIHARVNIIDAHKNTAHWYDKYQNLKSRQRDIKRERDAARSLVNRLLREKEESGWGPTRFQ